MKKLKKSKKNKEQMRPIGEKWKKKKLNEEIELDNNIHSYKVK